ncbi:MAG: DUF3606 domain-containing protein [Puniceicoccaceae bacterium]|nr:DUF3606 domain-containing protein [Puniceicoccaceae bacterium]
MGDDPNKKEHDGKLVSQQDHEVAYLKHKFPKRTETEIRNAIRMYGPSRSAVERRLS